MEVGLVKKINIDEEMQQAYLDYAMSVIVARALPDARDGLKPVHRRILYAMYDMGLRPDTPYKKSARIVGEVLGKYHPHGDMAVYDAMARMAQDFSMRYLLVDGQGNFGSVDGDPPAAMRYTEARLQSSAMQMLADIGKDTVDFTDNFDGTLTEPDVLPAAVPNLLVNGATGIAVGMSTSIPPHNLGEVVDALIYMLDNWEKLEDLGMEDLMRFVQGPDFPTGGLIIQEAADEGLITAYGSGRGRVTVQARAHLEEMERGRNRIIVTELPYMTNKSSLIERIAELVREERLEGIVDLRDESDRQGMRIVMELNKNADPEAVLRDLYKHTPMQSTFSFIMLALVDGEPRLLSLKQVLRVYIEHRLTIIKRRSEYDLEKARQREHILAGLRVALQNLDEIIDLIRKSPDADAARERLMKRFKLSQIQAQAILDMPLRRLAALERKKIELEYKEVLALIKDLEGLLRSPKRMRQVVAEELLAVKEAYGDRRRTHIIRLKEGERKMSLLTAGELTPDKTIWVTVTPKGLIGRSHDNRVPQLGGKDTPAWLVQASTREILYLVSEQGETAAVAVHALPEVEKPSEGVPLYKGSALLEGMKLAAIFKLPPKERQSSRNGNGGQGEQNGKAAADGKGPSDEKAVGNGMLSPEEERYIITVTRQGMVKKSAASELPGPSAGTFTLARVNEGDRLGWARLSNGKNEVLLVTANGMAIRFNEDEVRPMGLVAAGVMGMKLQAGDEVAGMELLPQPGEVFLLASDGSAKRVPASDFPAQGRYGQGVNAWKLAKGVRMVGAGAGKASATAIVHVANQEPIFIHLNEAPVANRAARGQAVKALKTAAAALPGGAITGFIIPNGETQPPDEGSKAGRTKGKKDDGPGGSKGGAAQGDGAARSAGKRGPGATGDGKAAKAAAPKGAGARKAAPQGTTVQQEPAPARRGAAKTAEPQAKPAGAKSKQSAAAAPSPASKAPAGKAGAKTPVKTTGTPVKTTGSPVKTTGSPVKSPDAPAKATDKSAKSQGEAAKSSDKPPKTTATKDTATKSATAKTAAVQKAPVKNADAPAMKASSPVKTTGKPVKTTGSPVKNTGSPAKSADKIAGKAAQKPTPTQEAPKATAKAPVSKTTAKAPQPSLTPPSPATKSGKSTSKAGSTAPGPAPTPPATKSGSSRSKAPASQPAKPPPTPQNKPQAKKDI